MAAFELTEEQENVLADELAEKHTEEELTAMADNIEMTTETTTEATPKVKAAEIPAAPVTEPKNDEAQLSAKLAEIEAKQAKLTTAKVQRFAEDGLVKKAKLHVSQLKEFVDSTMKLRLDDATEDANGKTALDHYLEYQDRTRAAHVELAETATVPDQGNADLTIPDSDEIRVRMAQSAGAKVSGETIPAGGDPLDNEFKAIMAENPKLTYPDALNLAYKRLQQKKG